MTLQHHGCHVEARWLTLTDGSGTGLRIDTARLTFDVSRYRVDEVTAAPTRNRLPGGGGPGPVGPVQVHLDASLRGAGTAACGPDTHHVVGPGRHRFAWTVRPRSPGPVAGSPASDQEPVA